MNQFDLDEGRLTLKALKILEKPPEIQNEDPFLINASLVTEFIMVRNVDEYRSGGGIRFQPDFMHQVFRDSNEIYGYKDFKLQVYFTALRMVPFIKYSYSEVVEDADIIDDCLKKLYEADYLKAEQEDQFLQILIEEENLKPVGELIKQYQIKEETYQVYRNTINTNGFTELKPNLQAMLLVLIDGAQYPCDSPNWIYYVLYRKDQKGYIFVGLSTIYIFNLSLHVSRYRISQMLFLPNFQRKGHGGQLLISMYEDSIKDPDCKQITVEDPSEDFQVMRDITDTKLLLKEFKNILAKKQITSLDEFKEMVLTKEQLFSLMKKTKLYSFQIRRAHQILLYSRVPKNNRLLMIEFSKIGIANLRTQYKSFERIRNPVIYFEDGETLNPQQMVFLEQSEKMQKKIVNYEEIFLEELSFYELVAKKLKKDAFI